MDVTSVNRTDLSGALGDGQPQTGQPETARAAFTVARQLNNLNITDREFSVVRDPNTHRFVVEIREQSTGTVLDQFPPEVILRLLDQLSTSRTEGTGDKTE